MLSSEFDLTDLHLVFLIDEQYELAGLILLYRCLGNNQHILFLIKTQQHQHIDSRHQQFIRVIETGSYHNSTGTAIHRVIGKIDDARMVIDRAIRQLQLDLEFPGSSLLFHLLVLLNIQHYFFTDVESGIDGIELHHVRQFTR